MTMPSRRLKHYKNEIKFFIMDKDNSDLGRIIYEKIDDAIKIYQKYIAKGHNKVNEIKHIEKKMEIVNKNSIGMVIKLNIHVHHYTSLYFDEEYYYTLLTKELFLKHGEVMPFDTACKMYLKNEVIKNPPNTSVDEKKEDEVKIIKTIKRRGALNF